MKRVSNFVLKLITNNSKTLAKTPTEFGKSNQNWDKIVVPVSHLALTRRPLAVNGGSLLKASKPSPPLHHPS